MIYETILSSDYLLTFLGLTFIAIIIVAVVEFSYRTEQIGEDEE